MRLLKPILLLLFFGLPISSFAQINTIKFEHYASNEGLSQSAVKCIQQDHLGYMWFGTLSGLNKYDGLHFTPYTHSRQDSTSLTSMHITTLFEDSQHRLWVGTPEGLNLFNRAQNNFQRFVHLDDNLNSLPNNYIHDILEDTEGTLWIATRGGLCKYDPVTNRFENFRKEENEANGMVSNNIRCLYEDSQQEFWIGYFGLDGLQKFDRKSNTFTTVLYNKEDNTQSLNVSIWSIFEDSQNNFWLGTNEEGLLLFDRTSNNFYKYKENPDKKGGINSSTIKAITEDNSGNLLLATEGGGLNVLSLENFNQFNPQFIDYQVEPLNAYSINDNFLESIYKDNSGLIWIGTKDSGVNKIDRGIQKFTHYQSNQIAGNNLTNKDVWSVLQDHIGNIWVGTSDGLNRIDDERINIDYFYHSPNDPTTLTGNHIYTIFQDAALDIWIGTDEGLTKLPFGKIIDPSFIQYRHEEEDRRSLSNNEVRCLLEDGDEHLWIGTASGLNLMNRSTNTFQSFFNPKGKDNNFIRCLLIAKDKKLWVGTEKGLSQFNYSTKSFINYLQEEGNQKSIGTNVIHCLFQDEEETIWVGTSDGLNKLKSINGKIEFESFNVMDGLPDNNIYAIRADRKKNLWLSTNTSITKFNTKTNTVEKIFTNKDGLQDGEFNPNASYKNYQGELFFGGSDGMNMFLPSELPLNKQKPPVVLTDFEIDYKSVPIDPNGQLKTHISIADRITLKPGDNKAFTFEFAALNYTQSQKNSYAYKLENYDDTWQLPPRNRNLAFYTNIDPGYYVFKVKAANNDDEWNEEGTSIELVIEPTFTQTLYFKVGLFLLTIGLGYLFYLNRVSSLRRRSATLEKMVEERTEQVQKQNSQLETTVKTLKETQAQLVESEKMASLGQLTAGIAHEINNPINFISSNVQALKMDFQDMQGVLKKVKELENAKDRTQLTQELIQLGKQLDFDLLEKEISDLLGGIERGTERTVNIVSSLRTFSRNSTETFAEADIHEGLDSTLVILNSQLNGHISIEKSYGKIPSIRCQISRLNQVFLNIINNSIQAINAKSNGTPSNGNIKISTKLVKNKVLVRIKDDGTGMDEDTRKRVFEPFYTTKDVGDGTGLGLSISYGIIEQHNGKIEVLSKKGTGTEFIIQLPLDPKHGS